MNLAQAIPEVHRLSELIDEALSGLRKAAADYAHAEHLYRKQKAVAWQVAPKGTVPEREAFVNEYTADERLERDLADGERQVWLEAIRSRRAQVSALQSLLAAERAEAEFVRTGP